MSLSNRLAHSLKSKGKKPVFEGLMDMEETLVRRGFPAMSPWWKATLKAHYDSGKLRLVLRVGRRGGKSSSLCRVAVAEGLFGQHEIPPGDVGVFVFISVRKDEAIERLRTIKEILKALQIPFISRRMEVQLKDKPIVFRVYPANFRSAVGMTCIGWVGDEMARWRDEDNSSNPATDVIASIKPAMATMRNAHEFYSSSPWAKMDAHHKHVEMGNTDEQNVGVAPSWVANNTLTIERCRELEQDEGTFKREYEAIPMDNDSSQFFDAAAIDACIDKRLVLPVTAKVGTEVIAGGDFAFRSDWSALVVVHKQGDKRLIADIDIMKPEGAQPLVPSKVCARFALILRRHGCRGLMADGHYRESIVEHLQKKEIAFFDAPARPVDAYVRARVLINQGLVTLPAISWLRDELLSVESKPTPSGGISIILQRREHRGHSDVVSALVLALYQRNGRKVDEKFNNFLPRGWTKEEVEEVKKIENEMRKNKAGITPYITGL